MHDFIVGQEVFVKAGENLGFAATVIKANGMHCVIKFRHPALVPLFARVFFEMESDGLAVSRKEFLTPVQIDLPADTAKTWAEAFRLKPNWIDPVKERVAEKIMNPQNHFYAAMGRATHDGLNDWALEYVTGHHFEKAMKAEIESLTKQGQAVTEVKINGWRSYEITSKPAMNFSEFSDKILSGIKAGLGIQIDDVQPVASKPPLRGKSVFESVGVSGRQTGKSVLMMKIVDDLEKQGHRVISAKEFKGGAMVLSTPKKSLVMDPASINKAWKKAPAETGDFWSGISLGGPSFSAAPDYHRAMMERLTKSPVFFNQQLGRSRREYFNPLLHRLVDLHPPAWVGCPINNLMTALDALMNGGVQKGNKGDSVRKVDRRKLHNVRRAYQNLKRVR